MRQIKFRAKRIDNGEWVYGHYTVDANDRHVIWKKKENWEVDESTLGQFTGLKDKNGVKIVEGDIIRHFLDDKPYSSKAKTCEVISQVVWSKGFGVADNEHNNAILAKDPSTFNEEPHFTTKEIRNEKGYGCGSWSHFSGCEVIGNVTDNKELLS